MIEIDKDVWIAAPESMRLLESNRRVHTYSSEDRKRLEGIKSAYESRLEETHLSGQPTLKDKIQELETQLNANFWYVQFSLQSGHTAQSADFDSRDEALAWLGEIGLNLRPFPFKEKKEEEE
jgi:hypothetical protein